MAKVLAFPLDRRRGLIRRQAERLTGERPRAAENILFHQLQRKRRSEGTFPA